MKEHIIRWKRGDSISLGKAISSFNKKINELQQEENKYYLPTPLDFKNEKSKIVSRKQLNYMINSLKKFTNNESSWEVVKIPSGEQLTKWEYKKLDKEAKKALKRITEEMKPFEEEHENSGFSLAQMGNTRYRTLESQKFKIENWKNFSGEKLKDVKFSIKYQGALDYKLRKAIIFKENYLKTMEEKYSKFDNYEILEKHLKSFRNPIEFADYILDFSSETYIDDLYYQSFNTYTQQAFNGFVESFGLKIKKDSVSNFKELK